MVIVVVVIVVVMKVVVVIVVVVIVAVVIVAAVIVAVVIVARCGARLIVIIACDSGAVHFSAVTGAVVLHWLSFKHSYGGLRRSPPVAPFASYFGCGSGAGPGCSL